MARVRFLLAALVAASLVSFVAAGGGESSGEDECGESAIWTVNAGQEKRCCTSWLNSDVDEFEYTAVPTTSGSWGPGSITFWVEEFDHFENIANPTKVDASKCALDYASSRTCTGAACEDPGSSSNGKCKADVDISAQGHDDICLVAKCTGGTCNDHKVEIKFHHSEDYDDDGDDDDDNDDARWAFEGMEGFEDFEGYMRCLAVCPTEGQSTFYEGECGAFAHRERREVVHRRRRGLLLRRHRRRLLRRGRRRHRRSHPRPHLLLHLVRLDVLLRRQVLLLPVPTEHAGGRRDDDVPAGTSPARRADAADGLPPGHLPGARIRPGPVPVRGSHVPVHVAGARRSLSQRR